MSIVKVIKWIVGALVVVCLLAVVSLAVVLAPPWLANYDADQLEEQARIDAVNVNRQMVLWIAGGLIAVVTLILTWRRDQTNRQKIQLDRDANFTTRYTDAIAQLGNDSQAIRFGGIHALQRIADDSPRDRTTIVQVLASFIRQRLNDDDTSRALLSEREDFDAAYRALRSLLSRHGPLLGPGLDLSSLDLTGIKMKLNSPDSTFASSQLNDVDLSGSKLQRALLSETILQNAKLVDVDLKDASLYDAYLEGADFTGANIANAVISRGSADQAITKWKGHPQWVEPQSMG